MPTPDTSLREVTGRPVNAVVGLTDKRVWQLVAVLDSKTEMRSWKTSYPKCRGDTRSDAERRRPDRPVVVTLATFYCRVTGSNALFLTRVPVERDAKGHLRGLKATAERAVNRMGNNLADRKPDPFGDFARARVIAEHKLWNKLQARPAINDGVLLRPATADEIAKCRYPAFIPASKQPG